MELNEIVKASRALEYEREGDRVKGLIVSYLEVHSSGGTVRAMTAVINENYEDIATWLHSLEREGRVHQVWVTGQSAIWKLGGYPE